jgi:hypothetical protein
MQVESLEKRFEKNRMKKFLVMLGCIKVKGSLVERGR